MQHTSKTCIIIPIYKEHPSESEVASLKQALKLLRNHDFYLICSDNLNISKYLDIVKMFENINLSIKFFQKQYFLSIDGYNRLLLTHTFYKKFLKYNFLLIYQLDAWIFKDEIEYWCNKGYDYIGAPWLLSDKLFFNHKPIVGIGNGGFSLRNVKKHIKVLNSFSYLETIEEMICIYKTKSGLRKFKYFISILINLTIRNNTFYMFNRNIYYEDYFWGVLASRNFEWFKVPSVKIALQFSFESNPDKLFVLNKKRLPMGCHAWEKNNKNFWLNFIPLQ